MFLLVTGASGAGKSTARRAIASRVADEIESVELHDVVEVPALPTLAWRQQATEAVVRRAIRLEAQGRHLLLSGDPVAPGEVLAAPSADQLSGVAACLLDVNADAQAGRLAGRGDDPTLLPAHLAFADWMRRHARDPRHMPHVLTAGGWEAMHWERWTDIDPTDGRWAVEIIDTSEMPPEAVAAELLAWSGRVLRGRAPVLRVRQ